MEPHSLVDNPPDPVQRIRQPELLPDLVRWALAVCGLGTPVDWPVFAAGYDDCNVLVRTSTAAYVVKIMSTARPAALSGRYVEVIRRAVAAGVRHPRLHTGDGRALLRHPGTDNLLVVMDFVPGATFLELGTYPDPGELAMVLEQIRLIHGIDLTPEPVHDWWAVPNIAALAAETGPLLDPRDRPYVEAAVRAFGRLDLDELPRALVHGDLTKANVMRTDDGGIAILDFAVANRYPRIHELAMVAVNLMHGDPRPLPVRSQALLDAYEGGAPLLPAERAALPAYVFAAAAMELLGAVREWSLKGNRSAETRYLLELGASAIRAARC